MSDRTLVWVFRVIAAIGGALAVIGSVVIIAVAGFGSWWSGFFAFVALFSVFFAVFVWPVVSQQPRNVVVWTMAASAFFGGLGLVTSAGAAMLVGDDANLVGLVLRGSGVIPADLPSAVAWILVISEPAMVVAIFLWLTFGLLLFPDGRLPSPRWRWVGVLGAAGMVVIAAALAWSYRPWSSEPTGVDIPILDAGFVALMLAVVLSLAALIVRLRRSSGATRDQFKWVVWGASIFVPTMVAVSILGGTRYQDLMLVPVMVASAIMLGAYGIAVGRYRLFDIDVVISRTVVAAGLAGFITVVYAVLVGAVGLVVGFGTGAALPLSIAATVVVALLFQPVRLRMRRWADRLVYGERATPYEVLSRFSERMRDTVATEDVIPQMAQLLTQGTGATQATVWMKSGNELRPVASWPENDPMPTPVGTSGELSVPGVDHVAPVEHDGELLGAVTVTMPRGEALTATEERLVDDVASQAGLVLRNARLIQQLRSSRQRLVSAQDEERRRLERDLHDGAQQQIIGVKIKLGLARRVDDAAKRDEMLYALMEDTDEAIQSLRDLAHGIYPPLLEAMGLEAALTARTAKAPVAVSVSAAGVGRYSREVEAAVYFCVLESAQNAVKHAEADSVAVTLQHGDGRLVFEVADGGTGFDPETQIPGRGLVNMADRLDALGGTLDVRSTPEKGTTIIGTLHHVVPLPDAAEREAGNDAILPSLMPDPQRQGATAPPRATT